MFHVRQQPDIDRPPRFVGTGWQLERPGVACGPTVTQDELLHREVSGICRSLVNVTAERHQDRSVERDADPLQGIEVDVGHPAFEPALDHPTDPGSPGEFGARPAATLTHRPHLAADPQQLFLVPPLGFDRER
jgi:hypothetical protein